MEKIEKIENIEIKSPRRIMTKKIIRESDPVKLEFLYKNYLDDKIRSEFTKEVLIERLSQINWKNNLGRHGALCLRLGNCSIDCVGSDCS